MTVTDVVKPIQIRFGKNIANYFDEIENVDIGNRKSDAWLIETDRPMIKPRAGTTRVWNNQAPIWSSSTAYSVWDVVFSDGILYRCTTWHTNSLPPSANWATYEQTTGNQFFYTGKQNVRRHYKVFNNGLYYLNSTTWTLLKDIGTNEVDFSQQRVPVLNIRDWSATKAYVIGERAYYNWVIYSCILGHTNQTPPNATYWVVSSVVPTEYTMPSAATGAEKVKKAAGDTLNATNNIGKVLLITSGVYKGCYASIIAWDGTEYTLWGAGIITALPISTTYQLYDFVSDVLMVSRSISWQNELFFDGIMELTQYAGYTTASLRQVSALTSTETVGKLVSFNNQCYTFKGSTVFYTGWFPGNPFFFNFTTSQTIGWNGTILDIFPYKTRLVTLWTNFVFSINSSGIIDKHTTSFGWIKNWYVNLGDDAYILTTDRSLISLNETINGVVGIKNVGDEIANYLNDFQYGVCFGMDSKKIYMYGQPNASTVGTMCVFDITYKTWCTFTGLRPASIISDGGHTYIADNNSDIIRVFDKSILTDVWLGETTVEWLQTVTSKEIDRQDIFSVKSLMSMYLSFENYTQELDIDVFMAVNNQNGQKDRKHVMIREIPVWGWSIGSQVIGDAMFWQSGQMETISVPRLKKIMFQSDKAYIFKFRLQGNAFYLNQIDIGVSEWENKWFFDAENTI